MPLPSHSRSAISFPEFQNQTEIDHIARRQTKTAPLLLFKEWGGFRGYLPNIYASGWSPGWPGSPGL